jgi:hypothetical protein
MDIFIIGYNISPKQHIWYNDASNRAHRVHCRNFQENNLWPSRPHIDRMIVLSKKVKTVRDFGRILRTSCRCRSCYHSLYYLA